MKRTMLALVTVGALIGVGCVLTTHHTIDAHITVDIRHIEEQAEDVLDFIEGKSDTLPGLEPVDESRQLLPAWLSPIQPVYAEELKSSSPVVTQIAESLRERYPKIQPLRAKGILGENNRGYMELRKSDAFEDPEARNEVQRLIAEENEDRKALYKEIVRLNKDAGISTTQIERVYAVERLQRAKKGEVFQLPPEGKEFDAFKASAQGKALGDKCTPEAWVTIE